MDNLWKNKYIKYKNKYLNLQNGGKPKCNKFNMNMIDPNGFPLGYVISPYHLYDFILEEKPNGKKYWEQIDRHPGYERYATLNNAVTPLAVFNNPKTKHLIVYKLGRKS